MLFSLQNITAHNSSTSTTRTSSLAAPCPFCNKHLAKYICPRCSQKYCSLECYRSPEHKECGDGFQRDKAEGMKVSREEKEKMLETLREYEFVAPDGGGALEFVGETPKIEEELDLDEEEGEVEPGDENAGGDDDDVEEAGDEEEEEDEESVRRRKDLEMRMAGLDI